MTSHLDYPSSSGVALLKSLTQIGYLSYDRKSMTYVPTTRLAQVSEWIPTHLVSASPYLGLMQTLRDVSKEAVTLCVQSDIHVQYLHVIEGCTPMRSHVEIGTRRPLAHASTGLALMRRLDDVDIEPILRRINFHNPGNRVRIDELMQQIHEVRTNAYAFRKGSIIPGTSAIAFPMSHAYLGRCFSVGVHGLVSQLELRQKAGNADLRRRHRQQAEQQPGRHPERDQLRRPGARRGDGRQGGEPSDHAGLWLFGEVPQRGVRVGSGGPWRREPESNRPSGFGTQTSHHVAP